MRRGDGPARAFNYTQPVLVATDRTIAERPETAAAAVRAIVATQNRLKADAGLATGIGEKLFSPDEARLIAGVVARDLPYYSPAITEGVRRRHEHVRPGDGLPRPRGGL